MESSVPGNTALKFGIFNLSMQVISEILVTPILSQIGLIWTRVSSTDFTLEETLPSEFICFFLLLRCSEDDNVCSQTTSFYIESVPIKFTKLGIFNEVTSFEIV